MYIDVGKFNEELGGANGDCSNYCDTCTCDLKQQHQLSISGMNDHRVETGQERAVKNINMIPFRSTVGYVNDGTRVGYLDENNNDVRETCDDNATKIGDDGKGKQRYILSHHFSRWKF